MWQAYHSVTSIDEALQILARQGERARLVAGATEGVGTPGEGQFIDIAMLDSIMPLMGWVAANLLIGGKHPALMGNDNFTAAAENKYEWTYQ